MYVITAGFLATWIYLNVWYTTNKWEQLMDSMGMDKIVDIFASEGVRRC